MLAYVLGVPGRFRGDQLVAELTNLGFSVRVADGVDGSQLDDVELAEICDQNRAQLLLGRTLGRGEVACAFGHLEIARDFASSGRDWCLVLEDDVSVTADLPSCFESIAAKVRGPAIVRLSKPIWRSQAHVWRLGGTTDTAVRRLAYGSPGTSGYMLSRKAALRILRGQGGHKIDYVADWPYRWRRKVHFWLCTQTPVVDIYETTPDSHELSLIEDAYGSRSVELRPSSTAGSRRVVAFMKKVRDHRRAKVPITAVVSNDVVFPLALRFCVRTHLWIPPGDSVFDT